LYLHLAYDQDLDSDTADKYWQYKFFEWGHSWDEIENMTIHQMGILRSIHSEKNRAEEHINTISKMNS